MTHSATSPAQPPPTTAESAPAEPAAGLPDLVVYSASWCPFCHRLKAGLDSRGVAYREVDVDHDADAAALVTEINRGNRVVPTVVFADGSSLTNPAAAEVADRLAALA